jgi:hypothetical protein
MTDEEYVRSVWELTARSANRRTASNRVRTRTFGRGSDGAD